MAMQIQAIFLFIALNQGNQPSKAALHPFFKGKYTVCQEIFKIMKAAPSPLKSCKTRKQIHFFGRRKLQRQRVLRLRPR